MNKKFEMNIWKLSWPMFTERITGGVVSFADIYFLAQMGDVEASVVGALMPLMMLGFFVLPCFATAGTSVAAQYLGAGRYKKVSAAYLASLLISVGSGLVYSILLFVLAPYVGMWLGIPVEHNHIAQEYLLYIIPAFVFVGARMAYSSILASQTKTRANMVTSIIMNAVNIGLNYCFVTGFWIFPNLGVAGVALSTTIAYALGVAMHCYLVHMRAHLSIFTVQSFLRIRGVMKPIFKVGLPSTIEPFGYCMQNMVVIYSVISLGTNAMSAHLYGMRFIFVDITFSFAMAAAAQVIMSHYIGQGKMDKVRELYAQVLRILVFFAFAVMASCFLFQDQVLSLFTQNSEIKDQAFMVLIFLLFIEPIRSINILGGTALKTVGDGTFSANISMIFMWGIIPVIFWFNSLGYGLAGVWTVLLLDESIRAGINLWRWYSNAWSGKIVIETV